MIIFGESHMMRETVSIALVLIAFCSYSQSTAIIGQWKTVDDNTGKERSIVEITKQGDQYFGKIIQLFREPGEEPDPICDECDKDDPRYNEKVIGMQIIRNMKFNDDDNVFEDGDILDPENGNVYDCKLWVEDGKLKVRGYLYFLYRTQTWLPASD